MKKNIVVQIKGTFGDAGRPSWYNGEYENRCGQVLFVTEGSDGITSTANLQLWVSSDNPTLTEEQLTAVPIHFLIPMAPRPKWKAVVLDGKNKGQILHIIEPGSGHQWVCTQSYDFYDEIAGDRLALYRA